MGPSTMDISLLVRELEKRIDGDYRRMGRWRSLHRTTGFLFTVMLLTLPLVLAAGLISSESPQGKIIALSIALVGGLNAAFQPLLHSLRRRGDMNNSRRLLDSFRAAIVKKQNNQEGLAELFDQYSERFAQLYEARGERLLDSELALQEQAPKTGVKKTEGETGSTANP